VVVGLSSVVGSRPIPMGTQVHSRHPKGEVVTTSLASGLQRQKRSSQVVVGAAVVEMVVCARVTGVLVSLRTVVVVVVLAVVVVIVVRVVVVVVVVAAVVVVVSVRVVVVVAVVGARVEYVEAPGGSRDWQLHSVQPRLLSLKTATSSRAGQLHACTAGQTISV